MCIQVLNLRVLVRIFNMPLVFGKLSSLHSSDPFVLQKNAKLFQVQP